jgi:ribosome-binding factor A
MIQAKRTDRIEPLIQRELSDVLLTKIKDPRLSLVTITRVRLTDDLRSARVYFCVADSEERKESVFAGFRSAIGFLKRELAKRLALRYVPDLRFFYDESFDRADSVNRLLEAVCDDEGSRWE